MKERKSAKCKREGRIVEERKRREGRREGDKEGGGDGRKDSPVRSPWSLNFAGASEIFDPSDPLRWVAGAAGIGVVVESERVGLVEERWCWLMWVEERRKTNRFPVPVLGFLPGTGRIQEGTRGVTRSEDQKRDANFQVLPR